MISHMTRIYDTLLADRFETAIVLILLSMTAATWIGTYRELSFP
jgi:hypothetical protein